MKFRNICYQLLIQAGMITLLLIANINPSMAQIDGVSGNLTPLTNESGGKMHIVVVVNNPIFLNAPDKPGQRGRLLGGVSTS